MSDAPRPASPAGAPRMPRGAGCGVRGCGARGAQVAVCRRGFWGGGWGVKHAVKRGCGAWVWGGNARQKSTRTRRCTYTGRF
eukprot:157185-Chlamydomonas_euryale.AAC.2